MAKVVSDVNVCNLALSNISQEPIVSITAPKDNNEKICAKWFDTTRRQVLAIAEWNFARGQVLTPQDSVSPPFGYEKQYVLPADYLKLVWIGTTRQAFVRLYSDYAIVGNKLQINYDEDGAIPIAYTKDLKSVALFSPWVLQVFVKQLALNISPEINRTATEIQQLEAQLSDAIKLARELDGQESKVIITSANNILSGRNRRLAQNHEITFTDS